MESTNWNTLISHLPNAHFLQSHEWGQVKAQYGWQPNYLAWDRDGKLREASNLSSLAFYPSAAALVLKRPVLRKGFAARLSILYAPKGPLLDWTNEPLRNHVLNDLQAFAKKEGAIFLKVDPDVLLGTGIPNSEGEFIDYNGYAVRNVLKRRGWRDSLDQIQFKNTVLIDLNPSEEDLLAAMKQKTRYNIRLAAKKGITLRIGTHADLPMLYKMYAETSVRDGFVIRDEKYYQTVWETFLVDMPVFASHSPSSITTPQAVSLRERSPFAEALIAEVDNEPVAAIFLFYFAGRAYYVYGMSRDAHREKMPTYFLQWEAMKRAKARGCTAYDLWGAPDVFDESDSMWGVYRFKEGLGGKVVRTIGAWDFAPNPVWYKLYSEIIPRLLNVMRLRGKARTRQALGGA